MNPIGLPLRRREDPRFLSGQARYLDDIVFPGAVFAKFVRSPHAHARILSIDADEARRAPGVEMVVPFGVTLHVSGANAEMLQASLKTFFARTDLRWEQIAPSLEDVFIGLMNSAKDNYQ